MKRWAIKVVLVLALIGAVLAGLSTSQHLRLMKTGFGASDSFCNINEYINCDLVNLSSYSTLLAVPVAWWVLLFYVTIIVLMLLSWQSSEKSSFRGGIALLLSLGSLAFSIRMAYISLNVLKLLCLECAGMYAVNLLLVIFLFAGLSLNPLRIFSFFKNIFAQTTRLGKYVAVLALFFGVGWLVMSQVEAGQKQGVAAASVEEKLEVYHSSQPYAIEVNSKWPVWGSSSGKVVIIKFADFQCPICKIAAEDLPPYFHEFRDQVQMRYVHFPLSFHEMAKLAAQASVCAQNKSNEAFWQYHDGIYKDQPLLNREFLLNLATAQGFDRAEFEKCLDAPETVARVEEDLALAQKLHITGTPTFLVNGKQVRYWQDGKLWQAILKEELSK